MYVSAMSHHYRVFECGVAEKGWVVFECGVPVKWRVRCALNLAGEDICDLEITDDEFDQLQLLFSCGDNNRIMHTLHSCKIECPALFRLQEKVAAVWKVPACAVQLGALEKNFMIGVLHRSQNIKSMDVGLSSRPPREKGRTDIHIKREDLERQMPGWHCSQAYWKAETFAFDDWSVVFEGRCHWYLNIVIKRAVFKRDDDELPATVIIELRSRDPDPDKGKPIAYQTFVQDFATYTADGYRLRSASALTLAVGPFDFKAYMAPSKHSNKLGFSLRLEIVEEKNEGG